jgi:hypothetical protein
MIPAGTTICGHHEVRVPDEQYRGGWRFSSVRRAEAYHTPNDWEDSVGRAGR